MSHSHETFSEKQSFSRRVGGKFTRRATSRMVKTALHSEQDTFLQFKSSPKWLICSKNRVWVGADPAGWHEPNSGNTRVRKQVINPTGGFMLSRQQVSSENLRL